MLRQMVAEAKTLKESVGGSVSDAFAEWLVPQYLLAAREKLSGAPSDQHWAILRAVAQDCTLFRRGDHSAARLQLDREELEWRRQNSNTRREQLFQEWLARPEIRKKYLPDLSRGLSQETLAKIERELRLL